MKIREMTPRFVDRAKEALLFGMVILFALGAGCSGSNNDLIPITTSSERAREYFRVGRDLEEKLRSMEARHYYNKAIALDSNFALAYLYLASTEPTMDGRLRLLNKAASFIESVSEGEEMMIRGRLARNVGDRPKEREYYQRLAALHTNNERAHNLLGNHYLQTQEYEQAVMEYQKAIRINSEFVPPYNGLGYTYSYLGKYAEAELAFLKYIELIPNDPNPYDSYAELLLRMGQFSQSLTYYQKALRKNPYFFPAYGGVASVHNYLGQYDEARVLLQTLFDRARNVTHQRMAYFALAVSHADEGDLGSALAQIRKSYALAKQAKDILTMAADLNTMGHILLELGKSDDALRKYEQAARLVEQSSLVQTIKDAAGHTYFYNATRVAISQGKLATAKKRAEKYRNLTATANDPMRVKLSHELAGTIALAEKEYQTALTELQLADLRDPYNLHRLAQAYQGLGDQQKSAEMEQEAATFYTDNNLNHALLRAKAKVSLAAKEPD